MATKPIGAPEISSAAAHTDQRQRRRGQHQEQALEALQLHHEDRDHQEQHEREHGEDTGLGLGAVFDRAAGNDVVAWRKLRFECCDIAGELAHDGRGLQPGRRFGLHGDGR